MSLNLKSQINLEARKTTNLSGFYFCGRDGHTRPNCFKLQALKQSPKQKVHVPKAQDPVALIHELVKVLNLYTNARAEIKTNPNSKFASKRVWMQKTQSQ